MESLPVDFYIMYVIVITFVLIISTIFWIKRKYSVLAANGIIFSLIIPLVTLVYTAQRKVGNELHYFSEQIRGFEKIAIFLVLGHLFLICCLLFITFLAMRKIYYVPSIHKFITKFIGRLKLILHKGINYVMESRFVKRIIPRKRKHNEKVMEETKQEM